MATGGFKAFEHVFTGTNYTNAYPYSTGETNVKALLKAITQGIISVEPKWGYDSNFTATADDFVKIGTASSKWYDAVFAQFLINSDTGSKLLVYYNPSNGYKLSSTDLIMSYNASYCVWGYGLCMSMIPGGSSQTWDISSDCTTAGFIPYEATRVIGTSSKPDGASSSAARSTFVSSQGTHRYVIAVKNDVIMVFWQELNSGDLCGALAVGKIYGQLCNSTDNGACSQYGCISFKNTATNSANYQELDTSACYINDRTQPFIYMSGSTSLYYDIYKVITMSCFYEDTTTTLPSSTFFIHLSAPIPNAFSDATAQSSTTNKTAFTPFLVSNIRVGNGTDLKGYLDTDVFRGMYYGFPYNTLFDNGKFIYVGSGLAVGWDASNTVILRT